MFAALAKDPPTTEEAVNPRGLRQPEMPAHHFAVALIVRADERVIGGGNFAAAIRQNALRFVAVRESKRIPFVPLLRGARRRAVPRMVESEDKRFVGLRGEG